MGHAASIGCAITNFLLRDIGRTSILSPECKAPSHLRTDLRLRDLCSEPKTRHMLYRVFRAHVGLVNELRSQPLRNMLVSASRV